MIADLSQLIQAAIARGPRRAVYLFPYEEASLRAAVESQERGLAHGILVGDTERLRATAAGSGLDLSGLDSIHETDEEKATGQALRLCREGQAGLLVNDGVSLRVLLPAVLDRETGQRTGGLLSGVSVLELAGFDRLLLLSDGIMVVSPDLPQRIAIVENAIHVAHQLEIDLPHVALLAATETVDPKSQVSVDAAQITVMSKHKQIQGAIIDGPLAFDNAISSRAAQVKGIVSEVAGEVDILIAPDLESGNLLLKTLSYLCRGQAVHAVVGGRVPLLLSSPGDSVWTRVAGTALGVLLSA